ncbi:MAG: MBOAT family O-acyltransferase [Thermoleophilia bacterium]
MLFVELRFVLFFLVVLGVYWALRWATARKVWLLIASYGFYAAWDYRFLGLIALSTGVDYAVGLALSRSGSTRARRLALAVSLVVNLGMLGYFKYAGFFVESAERLAGWLGFEASPVVLGIVLPVGISFYTFQTLSYSIDVYRGSLPATRNPLDFALFVGFFPQLVAGPIVRARAFLPQTRVEHRWGDVAVRAALVLILLGYVQKAVLADNLAPIVDAYYADPGAYGGAAGWLANVLFWVQIYGDFAGYSNMAIGLAALLGYQLPRNFDFPFLSPNVAEFWNRWHITLSTWIADYVLRPLRRPGQGWARYSATIVLSMTLFGFWHGAGAKFVLWGAINGLTVVAFRTWRRKRGRRPARDPARERGAALGRWALTMAVLVLTVSLFRADGLGEGLDVMAGMLGGPRGDADLTGFAGRVGEGALWLVPAGLLAIHWALARGVLRRAVERVPDLAFAAGYGVALPIAFALTPSAIQPFIYFQF